MTGFQSPNYTQTPNDLFDELLPEMGLAELKVVMCVVRHTFGYHRDEVKISIRTLARMTGLTTNSVMDGAGQAESHGMIERYIDGNKTTLWRAVVSVVPTKTPRLTYRDAGVAPTATLVGGKEKKEKKNKVGDEGNPLEKFDDPQFGQVVTDWQSLHTFLIPTHANLLGCMLDEWRAHQAKLPAGHPDKKLDPVAVLREAMTITGKNARNPHSLSYMDKILKGWMQDGYNHNPNERKYKHTPAKQARQTTPPPVQVSPERQEELRRMAERELMGARS